MGKWGYFIGSGLGAGLGVRVGVRVRGQGGGIERWVMYLVDESAHKDRSTGIGGVPMTQFEGMARR